MVLMPTGRLLLKDLKVNLTVNALRLCAYLDNLTHSFRKQALMKFKQSSGKRQERNSENVVNHMTINGD